MPCSKYKGNKRKACFATKGWKVKVKKHKRKGKIVKAHKVKKKGFFSDKPDPTMEEQLMEFRREKERKQNTALSLNPREVENLFFEQVADKND